MERSSFICLPAAMSSFVMGILFVYFFFSNEQLGEQNSSSSNPFAIRFPSQLEQHHTLELAPGNVRLCLNNVEEDCPRYVQGQLEHDWFGRFHKRGSNNRGGCYFEFESYSSNCPDVCESLFLHDERDSFYAVREHKVNLCKIGCSYAKQRSKQLVSTSCMKSCKQTKWTEDDFLSTAIPGFSNAQACELGCIIGNERPCPFCEAKALLLAGGTTNVSPPVVVQAL